MAIVAYSTLPVDNRTNGSVYLYTPETLYQTVSVTIHNTRALRPVNVGVRLLSLDGQQVLISREVVNLGPRQAVTLTFDVSNIEKFAVQLAVHGGEPLSSPFRKVLSSVTATDETGTLATILPLLPIAQRPRPR
ncbi:hypothetical protein [Bacillus rubiinfantis]|uniref:hypothetical protein n=1 Tax=Bacillus rubiinfantis TaxID=1499680 RepID=UPI0005A5E5CF|nr:hypothetical protein [Bacillus rubiinfantis]